MVNISVVQETVIQPSDLISMPLHRKRLNGIKVQTVFTDQLSAPPFRQSIKPGQSVHHRKFSGFSVCICKCYFVAKTQSLTGFGG